MTARPGRFLALVAATLLAWLALSLCAAAAFAQEKEPRVVSAGPNAERIVEAWNKKLNPSIERQNVALKALEASLKLRAPWLVLDVAEYGRQQQAVRVARDEARAQLKALEVICEEMGCDEK